MSSRSVTSVFVTRQGKRWLDMSWDDEAKIRAKSALRTGISIRWPQRGRGGVREREGGRMGGKTERDWGREGGWRTRQGCGCIRI